MLSKTQLGQVETLFLSIHSNHNHTWKFQIYFLFIQILCQDFLVFLMFLIKARVEPLLPTLLEHDIYNMMSRTRISKCSSKKNSVCIAFILVKNTCIFSAEDHCSPHPKSD